MHKRAAIYAVVVIVSIAVVGALLHLGGVWFPGSPALTVPAVDGNPSSLANALRQPLALLIVQLLAIILATQLAGALATVVRQPAVVGEIAAGLCLGPSLLGALSADLYTFLFPASSLGTLHLLSQLGVILFMFSVGLDVDVAHLRQRAPTAIAVSHFSILVPFILGVTAALALFTHYAPAGVPFHAFALFMGIALSITAFPVLARVLEDRGLTKTPLGSTALACAAVDDVTAWSLLAVVVTLVSAGGVGHTLAMMVVGLVAFAGVMIWVVRPWLERRFDGVTADVTRQHIGQVLSILLLAALSTELVGIHALFGAFVAGAMMPARPDLRRQFRERLEGLSSVFLLPIFFAYSGLRTQIGLLDGLSIWMVCLAIIITAVAGKLVGSMLAARWSGSSWHDAFVLGTLMNTRGLMELVALNIGYDLGILSPTMFTMLVMMALVTTAMTGPLLDFASVGDARRAGTIARR